MRKSHGPLLVFGVAVLVVVFLFSGQHSDSTPNNYTCQSGYDETTGKTTFYDCKCVPNAAKDKFTVVVNKNSAYNNPATLELLREFLDSVKKDVGLDNVGVSFFSGSTVRELDDFLESLYIEKDAGYAIIVGDEAYSVDFYNTSIVNCDLSLVENKCADTIFEKRYCKDILISWMPAPEQYGEAEKVGFVNRIIERYTEYHSNPNELKRFDYSGLAIHYSEFNDFSEKEKYPFLNFTRVYNSDSSQVQQGLRKQHVLLSINTHADAEVMALGLLGGQYTTVDEFHDFVSANQNSSTLFVDIITCGSFHTVSQTKSMQFCCWPQAFLDSGTWAYYMLNSGGESPYLQQKLANGDFVGTVLRSNPTGDYAVFGDITAHLPIAN